jgi:hypothetical protein
MMSNKRYLYHHGSLCPYCRGYNLVRESTIHANVWVHCTIRCGDCEAKWQEDYYLTAFEPIEKPIEKPYPSSWPVTDGQGRKRTECVVCKAKLPPSQDDYEHVAYHGYCSRDCASEHHYSNYQI